MLQLLGAACVGSRAIAKTPAIDAASPQGRQLRGESYVRSCHTTLGRVSFAFPLVWFWVLCVCKCLSRCMLSHATSIFPVQYAFLAMGGGASVCTADSFGWLGCHVTSGDWAFGALHRRRKGRLQPVVCWMLLRMWQRCVEAANAPTLSEEPMTLPMLDDLFEPNECDMATAAIPPATPTQQELSGRVKVEVARSRSRSPCH